MKAGGDVIVWDSGSAPYVTANGGVISIETGVSAVDDVEGLIAELLPAEQRALLERLGALSYELPPFPASPDPGCRSVGRELVGRDRSNSTLHRARHPPSDDGKQSVPEQSARQPQRQSRHGACLPVAVPTGRAGATAAIALPPGPIVH